MAALEQQSKIDEEVEQLKRDIARLGSDNSKGQYVVPYGKLFDDEKVEQFYEALLGTLKAAKKRGIVDFKGQVLLKGAHDSVPITLLIPPEGAALPEPPTGEMAAASLDEQPRGRGKSPVRSKSLVRSKSPVQNKALPRHQADMTTRSKSTTKTAEELLLPPKEHTEESIARFSEIAAKPAEEMCQFFLKSFIFGLKDDWKDVPLLLKSFLRQCRDTGDGSAPSPEQMNHIQAADFLQKNGKTRTASERKAELSDVDIDSDGYITFIEYLLLHYKVMILTEFYKRYEIEPDEDLSQDGVGLANVGYKLVDELLHMPIGMNPQIEAAIEAFMERKKAREERIQLLTLKAEAGGVKGLSAKQELTILESGDDTELNRIELTLQAAKRKAAKQHGSAMLADLAAKEAKQQALEKEEKKKRMNAKRAMFEQKSP